jgi:hypothetical protein
VQSVPEWNTVYGKTGSYGQRSSLSIQEQSREERNELIKAVHEKQVLVDIGEIGLREDNPGYSVPC